MLRTGHDFRAAAAFRIRLAHLRTRHLHAAYLTVGIHFNAQRLDVELELHAFFTRVFHFALRARHVLLITAIGADDVSGVLANRGPHAVHSGVATAKNHDAFAFHADVRLVRRFAKAHDLFGIGDQERQRIKDPASVFVFQPAAHGLIGPDAEEHRIVIFQQIVELYIAAHFDIEFELDAHAGEDLATAGHHLFFQLKRRNTKGQQTADFRMAIENHRLHAVAGQHVGARQARWTRADNGDGFTGLLYAGKVGAPAHFERFIVDIAFDVADGDRAELIVQRAGTLAQTILWANAPADFR